MPEIKDYSPQTTSAATDLFLLSEADGTVKNISLANLAESMRTYVKDIIADMQIGRITMEPTNSAGYRQLWCKGETIGNVGSGADYESADYEDLFEHLKTVGAISAWGNTGSEVWADGDTIKLPNLQGVVPKGTGSQTINTRSKSGPALGATEEDQGQGHWHNIYFSAAAGVAPDTLQVPSNGSIAAAYSASGGPITDGVNGTPRTGTTTRENSIGVNFTIGY